MIEQDPDGKRMVLKLVYYGPALSGKTTNLLQLHESLSREGRGELMVLDTSEDRTIFFDLLPFSLTAPSGLRIKVKLFTVPGQVRHDATRKAVLQRADGVAFIADSRRSEADKNRESFMNLEKNLSFVGLDVATLPLVVQFNKRDLPEVIGEAEIAETWNATGIPIHLASALQGWGVVETFASLLSATWRSLDARFGLEGTHGLPCDRFVDQLTRLGESE